METPLVVDHVLPVAAGGETVADNLVAACKPCNVGKSSRLVDAPPVPPALSLKGVRLGRHALGFKLVHVRLSHDTVARIDALAGSYGRAGFIRKAIEEALDRMEREQKG